MADLWVAECLVCHWQEQHETQDEAIAAAEEHVLDLHRTMPAHERLSKRVGHVQLRASGASPVALEDSPGAGELATEHHAVDTTSKLAPGELTSAKEAEHETKRAVKKNQHTSE
jgi:hypothetical protein